MHSGRLTRLFRLGDFHFGAVRRQVMMHFLDRNRLDTLTGPIRPTHPTSLPAGQKWRPETLPNGPAFCTGLPLRDDPRR